MRRKSALLASTAALFPVAYANTNAHGKLSVCATPQMADLDQAGYEALTWVPIGSMASFGETGPSTNVLSYTTWDTAVTQKAKGITDAGSPVIEVARLSTDPGQIILRAAGLTNFNYAFKLEKNDRNTAAGTPTILYNRGLVTGPKRPNGKNEDFDVEMFTLGLQQLEITVDPSGAGNPPVLTVAPTITGTTTVNNLLTSSTGTFTGDATIVRTYQWFRGGVAISGATNSTYFLVTADQGKVITVRVTGTNLAGSAIGFSAPTAAIA